MMCRLQSRNDDGNMYKLLSNGGDSIVCTYIAVMVITTCIVHNPTMDNNTD